MEPVIQQQENATVQLPTQALIVEPSHQRQPIFVLRIEAGATGFLLQKRGTIFNARAKRRGSVVTVSGLMVEGASSLIRKSCRVQGRHSMGGSATLARDASVGCQIHSPNAQMKVVCVLARQHWRGMAAIHPETL